MGAIVIPPEYNQQFGQNLAQLATGIAGIVNPFHDLQVHTRNAIAADPELAQKLADMEDASPGILEHLGLGKVGDEIAKIPPTQAQVIRKASKENLQSYLSGEKPLSAMPTGQQDVISRLTSGQNVPQYTQQGGEAAQAVARGVQASDFQDILQNPNTDPVIKQVLAMNFGTFGRGGNITPEILGVNDYNKYKTIREGLDNYQGGMHGLASDWIDQKPGTENYVGAAFTDPSREKEFMAAVGDIRSQRMADVYAQRVSNPQMLEHQVRQWVINSRGAVDANVARHVLSDNPNDPVKQRFDYLLQHPEEAKPGEESLVNTGKYLTQQQTSDQMKAANQRLNGFSQAVKDLKSSNPQVKALAIQRIQGMHDDLQTLSGNDLEIDENGNVTIDGKKQEAPEAWYSRIGHMISDMLPSGTKSNSSSTGNSAAPSGPEKLNPKYDETNPLQFKGATSNLVNALGQAAADKIIAAHTNPQLFGFLTPVEQQAYKQLYNIK